MLPLINDAYASLVPYVPGKPLEETERQLGLQGCIKLASNENPYGPSPSAHQAVQAAAANLHAYPDGGAYYLKQRLAQFLKVSEAQLLIGNGSNEIIEMLVRTLVRPGENMLYAAPSFIAYKLVGQAAGVAVRDVPLHHLRYDLAALVDAADAQTKLVFVANPNNPTGTYVGHAELLHFLHKLPPHVVVVLDEAYCEYAVASDFPDGLTYFGERERLVVLRTFSKIYGLAGLRVGYAVGPPQLIDYLNRGRQPFNVNTLGQRGATAALDDAAFVAQCRAANRSEMARLTPALQIHGLQVVPSQANFLLVNFGRAAQDVFADLLALGVIVRPMHGQDLPTWVRITVGTPAQNDRLLAAVDTAFG